MEDAGILTGDSAFNAHFGECIAAIGDIDDDGYQGWYKATPLKLPASLMLPLLLRDILFLRNVLCFHTGC